MSDDQDPLALDPALAAAYRAEKRLTADVVKTSAITRERLMFAACARVLERGPIERPAATKRARWTIVAATVAAASVGFATGRMTGPSRTAPAVLTTGVTTPARPAVDDATIGPMVETSGDASVDSRSSAQVAPATNAPTTVHAPATPVSADPAEALLLDQARAALRRRLSDDARTALDRHQRLFPGGQLAEERDVLLIEVALLQNRLEDANELLGQYGDQHPRGSLRRRVEDLQRQLDAMILHRR